MDQHEINIVAGELVNQANAVHVAIDEAVQRAATFSKRTGVSVMDATLKIWPARLVKGEWQANASVQLRITI